MDNTIDALRKLYVALGGDAADVADITIIPDMINAIVTVVGTVVSAAKSTELPAVTASDNGKVLKVVDGAWSVGTDNVE